MQLCNPIGRMLYYLAKCFNAALPLSFKKAYTHEAFQCIVYFYEKGETK